MVGGVRAGGKDGKLATVVAHEAEGHVGHHFTGFVKVYLGHKHLLAFGGGDGGVPGDDGQASVEGGLGSGGNLVTGVVGEHDRFGTLRDGVGDDFNLALDAVFRGGAGELQAAGGAELVGCFHRAFVGLVEYQDAQEFGQQDGVEFAVGHNPVSHFFARISRFFTTISGRIGRVFGFGSCIFCGGFFRAR